MTVITAEYVTGSSAPGVHGRAQSNSRGESGVNRTLAKRTLIFIHDPMIRALVLMIARDAGLLVWAATSEATAQTEAMAFKPELIVTDLLPGPGMTGLDLLAKLRQEEDRRIPAVILTNHRSPYLVQDDPPSLRDCSYIVLADLASPEAIKAAMFTAATGGRTVHVNRDDTVPAVTRNQAATLRLVASGLNNEQIAIARNRSCRAVELTVARLYRSLGVDRHSTVNPRVAVTVMYHKSGVTVR